MSLHRLLVAVLLCIMACRKKDTPPGCILSPSTKITQIHIAEIILDTAFATDTLLAGQPGRFSFTNRDGRYTIDSLLWDISTGGYTSNKKSFALRFPEVGTYAVRLIVYYSYYACNTQRQLADTATKTVVVLPLDHNSLLEGLYEGVLDTKPAEHFTISIKYWKHPNEDRGGYFLRNYVKGCTGDGIYPVPTGTGYPISNGYRSFGLFFYPCNASSDFTGFGALNADGDSITISHYGYNTAAYVPGETTPRWHVFKGRRL